MTTLYTTTAQPRAENHQLSVHVVSPIDPKSGLMDYYGPHSPKPHLISDFISQLKAIRAYLESGSKDGLIISTRLQLLHTNFAERWKQIMNNRPDACQVVGLSYVMTEWDDAKWAGQDPSLENLTPIIPQRLQEISMYWLSHDYALEVLDRYDRRYHLSRGYPHPNVIAGYSGGCLAFPPLALNACVGMSPDQPVVRHLASWGYHDYSVGDDESPLARVKVTFHHDETPEVEPNNSLNIQQPTDDA